MLIQVVPMATRWFLIMTLLVKALQSMGEFRDGARLWLSSWRLELQLKECGLRAARRRNLEESCLVWASKEPDRFHEIRQRCEARLAPLEETADLAKVAGDPASIFDTGIGSDALGIPCHVSADHLKMELHRQRHRGQPALWPNWIPRMHYAPPQSGTDG